MCVSWWEGKLRLQNKKGLLRAFTRLETFSPHFHSFLLPSSSHSTGGYTNKPVLEWSSSTSTTGEFWPKILLVKHFVFHQVKKKLLFLQTRLRVLPRVKMSICWNLAESKISSFPGPDRFYPSSVSHHHPEPTFAFRKLNRKLWQKWEMGLILIKIQITPEEPFVFCHRFGLGNVFVTQKISGCRN